MASDGSYTQYVIRQHIIQYVLISEYSSLCSLAPAECDIDPEVTTTATSYSTPEVMLFVISKPIATNQTVSPKILSVYNAKT
jgi:hypothetical protein